MRKGCDNHDYINLTLEIMYNLLFLIVLDSQVSIIRASTSYVYVQALPFYL